MLSHLSSKFNTRPSPETHEPRAALFLNRYTRTLTIMYATNGLADVLGMTGEQMRGKSFYYCIQENCLQDSVRCLENAKANDSIAYLRFWFRDPRQDDHQEDFHDARMDVDGEDADGLRSSDEDHEMGGAPSNRNGHHAHRAMEARSESSADSQAVSSASSVEPEHHNHNHMAAVPEDPNSRTPSGDSNPYTHEAVFGEALQRDSSASSTSNSANGDPHAGHGQWPRGQTSIELEAVVSCTSDGLVVCLRRARPAVPLEAVSQPVQRSYANGLFAVPWAAEPILPSLSQRPQFVQHTGFSSGPVTPRSVQSPSAQPQPNKVSSHDFMNSIRDIAVFAWALNGINGSLASFTRGTPRGESQPAAGLPIWQPEATQHEAVGINSGPNSGVYSGYADASGYNRAASGVDPGRVLATNGLTGSHNAVPPPNFSMPLSNGIHPPRPGFHNPHNPR